MSVLKINGGRELYGEITVHGAKNSVLPILAASLLAENETVIHNCPRLSDVDAAIKILTHLGCIVEHDGDTVRVDSRTITRCDIPNDLMHEMRSSIIFLGAIISRCGEAVLSMPGGCELGPRPIDMHLAALRSLGAEIDDSGDNIICRAGKLHSARIDFLTPSVGATENAVLAASGAEGTTIINNAAREPEIVDLCEYLNKLGACIVGAGSSVIIVEGRKLGKYAEHSIIPDRIVTATYLSAVACAGGEITVMKTVPEHVSTILTSLSEMGCFIETDGDAIRIAKKARLKNANPISTMPYPGFPTDAQPMLMAACLTASGSSVFVENIFENRFRHAEEFLKMGANISMEGKIAIINGVEKLHGARVDSTDLRGGAAMVIAALGAEGITEVGELHHIDRGYDNFEKALSSIGADIVRI